MIKTTLGTLVDAEPVLELLGTMKLPIKTAYSIAKLARLVKAETQIFMDKRNEFITELGAERDATPAEKERTGQSKVVSVTNENSQEFVRRIMELAAIDVELSFDPLSLDSLQTIELTPREVDALGPLVN